MADLEDVVRELTLMNLKLDKIEEVLSNDRSHMWKLLIGTITGAFLLIGIKLVLPS